MPSTIVSCPSGNGGTIGVPGTLFAGATGTAAAAGGVDANASKELLYGLAQRLDIPGRSEMTKDELVEALQKANDRETAESREE